MVWGAPPCGGEHSILKVFTIAAVLYRGNCSALKRPVAMLAEHNMAVGVTP